MEIIKGLYQRVFSLRQRVAFRYALFRLRGLRYRGSQRECVCCGGKFRLFLPYGNPQTHRAEAACPSCNMLERNRLMKYFLLREMHVEKVGNVRVLHFAPEYPLEKWLQRLPNIRYCSADIEPDLAQIQADLMALPFADASYDWVICSHVLAHVPDEAQAMREIYRVLAPGGVALIQTRINSTLPTTIQASGTPTAQGIVRHRLDDNMREHGRDFAAQLAAFAPFQVETRDYATQFSTEERLRYGLRLMDDAIFVCMKKKG